MEIKIKDVLVSKMTPEFEDLVKSIVFSITKEVNGELLSLPTVVFPLDEPNAENYIAYKDIDDTILMSWIDIFLQKRSKSIESAMINRKKIDIAKQKNL